MPVDMGDRRKHLEFLRKTAKDAIWSGDYERALTLYEDGLALSRSWKDRELEDLFTCNRATTLLEMDRQDFDLSRLKEIVLRNPSSYNGVLAAHTCAHAHEVRKEYGRALFYAKSALQKSRELGFHELTASSYNILGNLELHESQFDAAQELFQDALEHLERRGESDSVLAAQYMDNLGYCHIALERIPVGMPLVKRSVEIFEQQGARQALDYPSLDLCFAYLRNGELDDGRALGLPGAGPRQRVPPRGRGQELALPPGRDRGRDRARAGSGRALRSARELLPELPGAQELPPPDQPRRHDQPEGLMRRAGFPPRLARRRGPGDRAGARRSRSRNSRC